MSQDSRFNMFLVGGMVDGESVIGSLQILDANFELFVDSEPGIVHLAKGDCLLCQVLKNIVKPSLRLSWCNKRYNNCSMVEYDDVDELFTIPKYLFGNI